MSHDDHMSSAVMRCVGGSRPTFRPVASARHAEQMDLGYEPTQTCSRRRHTNTHTTHTTHTLTRDSQSL